MNYARRRPHPRRLMLRVNHQDLQTVGEAVLGALGTPGDKAYEVVNHLVESDLRGHGSHGIRLLPTYASLVQDDVLVPDATPTVETTANRGALIDGQRGFGQLAGREAIERGIELATGGVALVGIRNTTHLGRIGTYGERATEAGMIFAALVSMPATEGSGPVAPLGSAEGRLGTNPICFAVPAFDALPNPVVADMATSQVSVGKVQHAIAAGESLDSEWTTTEMGQPVPDGEAYVDGLGAILPLGGRTAGHKGFGLAIAAELFASLVGNGAVSGQTDIEWGNRAAFFVADPTVFSARQEIEERLLALVNYLNETDYTKLVETGKSTRPDRGVLPGGPEYRLADENRRRGVPMSRADLNAVVNLAADLCVDDSIPDTWSMG